MKFDCIQSMDIMEIPDRFKPDILEQLPINGGNVISVEVYSPFGEWLISQGFVFNMPRLATAKKTWAWLVVFR